MVIWSDFERNANDMHMFSMQSQHEKSLIPHPISNNVFIIRKKVPVCLNNYSSGDMYVNTICTTFLLPLLCSLIMHRREETRSIKMKKGMKLFDEILMQ